MKKVAEFWFAEFFAKHVKLIAVIGVPLFTAACSNAPPQQTSNQYQNDRTGSIARPVVSRPATVYVQPYPRQAVYAPPPQRVIYAPAPQSELRRRQLAAACETTASVPRGSRTAAYSPRYADTTGSITAPGQYQAPVRAAAMWHVVAPGETLSTIARHYRVSVIEIARINELRNFPQIRSGGMLLIPLT